MKRILIISPGYMPIIRNRGGAIEELIRIYLNHNEVSKKYILTIYSAYSKNETPDSTIKTEHTIFRDINLDKHKKGLIYKVNRLFQKLFKTPCARPYIKRVIKDLVRKNELDSYNLIIVENCENDLSYIGKHLKTKTPIVLHLHNDYINRRIKGSKKAIQNIDAVWCVSKFIKQRVDEVDAKKNNNTVIYNAVDCKDMQNKLSEKEKNAIREKINISPNDYVYIYAGRIMPSKGVKELVTSFADFSKNKKNVKLLLVGGPMGKNAKDRFFKKIEKISKLNKNIIMTGRVDRKELYKYYQISNCQVIPTVINEAFGLVALEGIKNNLTIISTDTGGLAEALEEYPHIKTKTDTWSMQSAFNRALKQFPPAKEIAIFSVENYCHQMDQKIESYAK